MSLILITNQKVIKIEGMILLKIPAKSKVFNPKETVSIEMLQKLNIQVEIFDNIENRLMFMILLLVFLEIFDISEHMFIVLPTCHKQERIEKLLLFELHLLYLFVLEYSV